MDYWESLGKQIGLEICHFEWILPCCPLGVAERLEWEKQVGQLLTVTKAPESNLTDNSGMSLCHSPLKDKNTDKTESL